MLLNETGLLQQIMPELILMQGVAQSGHHLTDVWIHSLDALAECPSNDPVVRFATLLHDDVIDDNNTRRNGKSFKKEYGNKLSILTGDYIISKACSLLFSSNIDRYVQKSFIRESCSTAYGAYLEHHLSKAPTVENYIRVASLKTGSLFKLACLTGSCISKKPFATIRQSATFGKCLGIIFQIQNDVDAYMHKHHAQSEDFIQKNITFPIVLMKKHGLLCIQEFINKNECCIFQKIKEFINSNNFSSLASAVYDKYLKKIYDFSAQMPSEYSLIHAP
jgi:geranylgeranyl pyrophosphate synthase